MLALKEGGRTTGVAYRLPDDAGRELTLLWKREMIRLLSAHLVQAGAGRRTDGECPGVYYGSAHPLFEPDTSAQVIAPLIARASGPLGTNAQYLFSLEQALRKLGMHDASLDDLVASVRALLGESDAGRPERAQKKTPGMTGRPIADQ
jgi:cation transport protein ChaC